MGGKTIWGREGTWKRLAVLCAAGTIVLWSIQPASGQNIDCGEGKILKPVRGKIFNNAVAPGTTLGTVHLQIGDKQTGIKMKCGLLGQDQSNLGETELNFLHTFVCDDKIPVPGTTDTIHSQFTVYTTGYGEFKVCPPPFPPGAVYGPFWERSIPVAGTGRGLFDGVEEGLLYINGTINCFFSIDMEFDGEVCLPLLQ